MSIRPHLLFLALALLWGSIFVLLTPPFQVPDEFAHFYRAFQISEGTLLAERSDGRLGGNLPRGIEQVTYPFHEIPGHPERRVTRAALRTVAQVELNPADRVFIDFPNTALYTPVPYAPQALGMLAGRVLDASPLQLLYLARFANLAVWVAVITLAIRITPVFNWLFMLLALTPMSLFQAASASADGLTNALAFLVTAHFLSCAFGVRSVIGRRDVMTMLVLGVLLALSKNAYAPLILLYFLIPTARSGTRRRYGVVFAMLLACVALALLASSAMVSGLYVPYSEYDPLHRFGQPLVAGVAPLEQLAQIIGHPFRFLGVVVESIVPQIPWIVATYVGVLGWLDTPMPGFYYAVAPLLLALCALLDGRPDVELRPRHRLIALCCATVMALTFCAMMYMSWSAVGAERITNFQGRYFIPIVPTALLLLYNRRRWIGCRRLGLGVTVYAGLSLLLATWMIAARYYG